MSAYEVVRMYICMWYVDCVYSNLALQDIFLSMLVKHGGVKAEKTELTHTALSVLPGPTGGIL